MKENISEIVLGGGCFWCLEAVFQKLKGVKTVQSGYTAGMIENPGYREVCTGFTGHNEVIQIKYDEQIISYEQLLEVFFSLHDPTTLNRQGNDIGNQYRSGIYYLTDAQKIIAEEFIENVASKLWNDPIVTELKKLDVFYPAESDHHEYYENNKQQAYCKIIINPKLQKLRSKFQKYLIDGTE